MRIKLLIASIICLFLAMIISAVAWGGEFKMEVPTKFDLSFLAENGEQVCKAV